MPPTTPTPAVWPDGGNRAILPPANGTLFTEGPPVPVEIEAKMRLSDRPALEARLRELGAVFAAELLEVNIYFDTPAHSLKSSDRGLRIRVERRPGESGREVVITHKGPRAHGKLKSRSETEVRVESEQDASELLGALGYFPVLSFEKRRRRHELDGCRVELDTLPYLGDFVEIEGDSDASVLAVRQKLGLGGEPMVRASYIAMLTDFLGRHNIHTTHVGLDATVMV